jgi:hypothetical protein
VIDSSNNTIINRNDNNSTINTGGEKNADNTDSNMIIHKKQRCKAPPTTLSTSNGNEIEQETCPREQINPAPVSMISHSLPPLPPGNLPTANNLMSTRLTPSKKKRNK